MALSYRQYGEKGDLMNGYKLSKYNVLFKRDSKQYLWNTLSGALIALDDAGITYLNDFKKGVANDNYSELLLQNGCIVDERYDELGRVIFDAKMALLDESPMGMHYTIAPGLGCNYNCPYCFEKGRTAHMGMTRKIQDMVCDFIIKAAERNHNLKHLDIRWFGGEPLLYLDAIVHISERLINYCKSRDLIYTAGIVTNGRYLSPANAKVLKRLNVNYVQLSIDGMRDAYALSKGTVPEDFDATIDNLERSAEILPITVRINVSESIDEAKKLTDYLLRERKLDGRIKVYIAHIRDYSENDIRKKQKSHSQFLDNEKKFFSMFALDGKYHPESLAVIKPKRRNTPCWTICRANYCIGPEGELYRCEHFFGRKNHVVGTIQDGSFYSLDDTRYLQHIYPSKCKSCQMLPVCAGGCMNDVKNNETAICCEKFKERLIDYLLLGI